MRRVLYLGYYLRKLNKVKFYRMFNYVVRNYKKNRILLWLDIIYSSLMYNISLEEYFLFHFYKISNSEKKQYAGTGYMYEYQLKMNPVKYRNVLEDKLCFLKEYSTFIKHKYLSIEDFSQKKNLLKEILSNNSGRVVIKSSNGQCGKGVKVIKSDGLSIDDIHERIVQTNNDFIEEYVQQHDRLNVLSSSGLNTVRIITQINKFNEVELLGARLRITVNSAVDNLAAGNIAVAVNIDSGIVESLGIYSDITQEDEVKHPVSGVELLGFKVPFWNETIKMVKEAALINIKNKSIGWDVAITDFGPELIEGNHDWCKLLWQLPVKKGLKTILDKHLTDLK